MNQPALCYQDGFRWFTQGNVTFKGYLHDENGRFRGGQEAVSLFGEVDDEESLTNVLKRIDVAYTVIIRLKQALLIGTDPMGLFPLLYANIDGEWVVSDSSEQVLSKKKNWEFNEGSLPEFHAAGFVLGRETLIRDVFRTQAGEVLLLKGSEAKNFCYHYYLPERFVDDPREGLKSRLQKVLANVSGRLLASLGGKTAIVPLSGGYDSRLIACMLKNAGYAKVICLTYGRPNTESELSQKVANILGYKWIFVNYRDIYIKDFHKESTFRAYADFAGMLGSMPYLQEYFAVMHLKKHGLIPDDSVFLPGHTGDYIAGSYTEKTIRTKTSRKENPKELVNKYFLFLQLEKEQKKQIEKRLKQWFAGYDPPRAVTSSKYDIYTEDWDLKEKFSKFIFNSAKVFPFFGYQYRLPLWDAEFRAFFRELPFQYKSNKTLYDQVIAETYFKPMGVHFSREEISASVDSSPIQKIKDVLRVFVPSKLRMQRLSKRDYICYEKFTNELISSMKGDHTSINMKVNSYNAFICQWYANEVCKMAINSQIQ